MADARVKGPFGFIHNGRTEAELVAERNKLVQSAANNGRVLTSVSVNGSSSGWSIQGAKTDEERLALLDLALHLVNPTDWPAPVAMDRKVVR